MATTVSDINNQYSRNVYTVEIPDTDYTVVWDMPEHFDYHGRQRVRSAKLLVLIAMTILVILTILFLSFVASQASLLI